MLSQEVPATELVLGDVLQAMCARNGRWNGGLLARGSFRWIWIDLVG